MKQLVLIGGGHAHLHAIRHFSTEVRKQYEIILISASPYQYYSGMFSGYAEGLYEQDGIRFDLRALAEQAGIRWMEGCVTRVDRVGRRVMTDMGDVLPFDVLSINVGSVSNSLFGHQGLVMKPSYKITEAIHKMRMAENPIVIGGGAAGVEMALSLAAWRGAHRIGGVMRMVTRSRLLPDGSDGLSRKVKEWMRREGIQVFENEHIHDLQRGNLLTDRQALIVDQMLVAIGSQSPSLLRESGFDTDRAGAMLVNDHLQSETDPGIFGAGDCVTLSRHPSLPKNGVYAIRQAPVLSKNLQRYMMGKPLTSFEPQETYLSILSLGKKKGLLRYGDFYWFGHSSWLMKDWIDRNFMRANSFISSSSKRK
ncbi:NAD(P)/FAD-dependent oxidoreductase [Shouchella shacheensis]|uniref:NAD(P)/FAD-dependent oxidoreductase n=1 Tax=Shouchella shacheensis TaxID=1649580 RepID=UPI00073FD727|nr:FAD-dependent oxidoreductase [Shouchella shacheensis]